MSSNAAIGISSKRIGLPSTSDMVAAIASCETSSGPRSGTSWAPLQPGSRRRSAAIRATSLFATSGIAGAPGAGP